MSTINKTIILPFFDCFDLVLARLAEISALGLAEDTELILVNDGSVEAQTYSMIESARSQFPFFRFVGYETNRGFSSANNLGEEYAKGEVLFFISSDVQILKPFWNILGEESLRGCWLGGRYLTQDTGWNRFGDNVFYYLEGWFLACLENEFENAGRWDTGFDPHDYEDIDLSFRAIQKGYHLAQVPAGIVQHLGCGTLGRKKSIENRRQITERNKKYFMEKWDEFLRPTVIA
jgi:GT2 family glycosyltransferase